jgi:DNA-binding NarL/FixJ family response regulator
MRAALERTRGTRSGAMLRVVIADDSYLIREGLHQVLALSPELCVIGRYADAPSLLAAVDADPPDVVVTDMRMPPSQTDEGIQVARRLRESHPGMGVIVLSQHESQEVAAQLLTPGAGGRAYLLKDRIHDLDHLVSTIKAVAAGECRIDARLIDELLERRQRRARTPLDGLTPRQRDILADVAEGKSKQAIANERHVSLRAVEKHVSEIFGRLGLATDESSSRRVRATLLYLGQRDA